MIPKSGHRFSDKIMRRQGCMMIPKNRTAFGQDHAWARLHDPESGLLGIMI